MSETLNEELSHFFTDPKSTQELVAMIERMSPDLLEKVLEQASLELGCLEIGFVNLKEQERNFMLWLICLCSDDQEQIQQRFERYLGLKSHQYLLTVKRVIPASIQLAQYVIRMLLSQKGKHLTTRQKATVTFTFNPRRM